MMTLAVISIDRESLPEHTDKEFEAWLCYCVGEASCLDMDNPLSTTDMEAVVKEWG